MNSSAKKKAKCDRLAETCFCWMKFVALVLRYGYEKRHIATISK